MQKIFEVFNGFLKPERIKEIELDYEKYKSYTLTQLGVDSLAIMGLVLKIEELFNIEIDYETFSINDVDTLEKLFEYIKTHVVSDKQNDVSAGEK